VYAFRLVRPIVRAPRAATSGAPLRSSQAYSSTGSSSQTLVGALARSTKPAGDGTDRQ
jgi:hypothetical protein